MKFDVEDFESNGFKNICILTYGFYDESLSNRYLDLYNSHKEIFNINDVDFYSSPGRIEIIGNHTDHNGGKVLCAAINYDTLTTVSKRDDGIIEVKSSGYPKMVVDVNHLTLQASEIGTSQAIIKGVVDYYIRSGNKVGGFNACMTSNVPKGAGVSSSSSFELAIAEILNVLYNDSTLSDVFKAKASQYAENAYFGKPCGLMDQSAIALGGVNLIDFKDFDNPIIKKANWNFNDLDIYVIATGGDHSNLTADYAAIPKEMKDVASIYGAKLLREVDVNEWNETKLAIKEKVSPRAYLRAEHFFEENIRVDNIVNAIDLQDEASFLDIVNASGLSSRNKLQNTYSKIGKNHNLENALDTVVNIKGVKASRVHGGGFAGTILVFANKDEQTNKNLVNMFGIENVFKLAIRKTGACKIEWEKH